MDKKNIGQRPPPPLVERSDIPQEEIEEISDYKIVIEKSFYPIDFNKASIGAVIMVKNESLRIGVTLKSLIGHVDALIIYDTGSTDNTMDIIKDFSEANKINLYMIQGVFVNFSVSRNVLLKYAEKVNVKYLLKLDCNDELRGGKELREYTEKMLNAAPTGFLICQQWWSGAMDKYYNVRLVKNRCGWRYHGSVHEWPKRGKLSDPDIEGDVVKVDIPTLVLYQDRTQDDDKSAKRFFRDKVLLLESHKKDPHDARTLFYLAQTCMCLKEFDMALYYSKLRIAEGGFEEERFLSFVRCGDCAFQLGHGWNEALIWYIKAYEHSLRIEPLIKMIKCYYNTARWHLAYMYCREACKLVYPEHCILFVDRSMYDYERWHLMGIIAYHMNKFDEGKKACEIAISQKGAHYDIDMHNLQEYINIEKKLLAGESIPIKKHGVINTIINTTSNTTSNTAPTTTISPQRVLSTMNKSPRKLIKDRDAFLEVYKVYPTDTQNLFQLAYTYFCLKEYDMAYYYFQLRLAHAGFEEEKFISYMCCGDCCIILEHGWYEAFVWYIKAYEHSPRIEPLIKITEYYRLTSKWHLAYIFSMEACNLDNACAQTPTGDKNLCENNLSPPDDILYDYQRWHLMGIIAFYIGKIDEGKKACEIAIAYHGPHYNIDLNNLQVYVNYEKNKNESKTGGNPSLDNNKLNKGNNISNSNSISKKETKKQFIARTVRELALAHPGLPEVSITKRAEAMWRKRKH